MPWKILAKLALQAGKSYWDKKGFKGAIDDFNKIKEQFSTSNRNYDVEDEFDEFEVAYEEAIENDNLDIALSLVEDLYSNIAKDHLYYYFIANAYFNALHIDRKNFEKAIHNFKIAYSKAPNGSEAQVHYKERYTDLQEIYVDIQKYDELRAKIEKLCDNKEFFLAKEVLDKYYDNKGSDYKKTVLPIGNKHFGLILKRINISMMKLKTGTLMF